MPRVFLRFLARAKETRRAVVFIEQPEPSGQSLFGPERRIYLSKDLVGTAKRIIVKVEIIDSSGP